MPEKPTEILIHKDDTVDIEGTNPPVKFVGKGVYLRRAGEMYHGYYRLSDLSRTGKLKIFEMGRGGKIAESGLPQEMVERISRFLQQEKDLITTFDCHSFVHFVHNIPFIKGYLDVNKWKMVQSVEKDLVVGDAVFLSKSKEFDNIVHSAIYLGNGRYLSKFGSTGKLVVTDLANIKKGWEGEYIFQARPVNKMAK